MSYDNSFEFLGNTINISAGIHYGAAGAGVEFDFNEGKFKLIPPTYGIVPEFSFDLD